MNLPAPIRAFQQSYTYHVLKSAIYAGLTAGATAYFGANREAAGSVAVLTFLGALQSGIEHGPDSASFKSDGNPIPAAAKLKEMSDNVVALQAAAIDPKVTTVNQSDANKAANVVEKISADVSLNNAIIKSTLENAETKNDVSK